MVGVKKQKENPNMRQNLEQFSKSGGKLKWGDIPLSFQKKLQEAAQGMYNLNDGRYTFHYEVRERRTPNTNFVLHKNNAGYDDHLMTFIYYYEIEGINTSLNFYERRLGKPSWFLGMRFGEYQKTSQVNIKKGNIISFGGQAHKPEAKAQKGATGIKRYTLAIFVTGRPPASPIRRNIGGSKNIKRSPTSPIRRNIGGSKVAPSKTNSPVSPNNIKRSPTRPKRSIRGTRVAPNKNI